MLKNGQTYFKNLAVHEHHEIFKVCLAIFQHICLQASLQASLRFWVGLTQSSLESEVILGKVVVNATQYFINTVIQQKKVDFHEK